MPSRYRFLGSIAINHPIGILPIQISASQTAFYEFLGCLREYRTEKHLSNREGGCMLENRIDEFEDILRDRVCAFGSVGCPSC